MVAPVIWPVSEAIVRNEQQLVRFLDALRTAVLAVSGGGGAPIDATYLTLSLDPTLTQERLFTPGTNLTAVDGGANSTYTLNATKQSPLTTKGDIWTYAGADARQPIGADRTMPLADSAQANGWSWIDPTAIPTIVGGGLGGKRTGYFVSNSNNLGAMWGSLACAAVVGSHTNSLSTNKSDSYLAQYWNRFNTAGAAANTNVLAAISAAGPTSLWFSSTTASGGAYFKARAGTTENWVSGWAMAWGWRASVTNPAGGTNPSAFVDVVQIGFDAADANLQVMNNDASGTCTKTDLGASFAIAAKQAYDYELWWIPNSAVLNYRVVNIINGAVAVGSCLTNTPTANTVMQWMACYMTNGATAVTGSVDIGGAFYETIG